MNQQNALKNLQIKIVMASAFISLFLSGSILIVQYYTYHRGADVYVDTIKNYALVGDIKEVRTILLQSLKIFEGVSVTLLPTEQKFEYGTVGFFKVNKKLYFNDIDKREMANFVFNYDGRIGLVSIVIVNLINIAISLIIFRKTRLHLTKAFEVAKQFENAKALTWIAQQVAHDIRSPLSAISVAADTMSDENPHRSLIKKAYLRLNAIAEDLLVQSKENYYSGDVHGSDMEKATKISDIIKEIIEEKEIGRGLDKISSSIIQETNSDMAIDSEHKSFVLRRIISNLINNSIEASPQNQEVRVRLYEQGNNLVIEIADLGQGISPNILKRIGERGLTTKKDKATGSGYGLGIYSAVKSVDTLGGSFEIESELGAGTTVKLLFNFSAKLFEKNSLK